MVKDCLIKADPVYNFLEIIREPEEYVKLDDNIIYLIENSSNPLLKESQEIIKRLNYRDLYMCLLDLLIPLERQHEFTQEITAKNIVSHQASGNPDLTEDDIEVVILSMDYGNGDRNPFDSIYFYKKNNSSKNFDKIKLNKNYENKVFKELYLRVYVKCRSKVTF